MDIDLISKIFKVLSDASSGLSVPILSKTSKGRIFNIPNFIKVIYSDLTRFFLNFVKYPGVSKDNTEGFVKKGLVPKSRSHRNEEFRSLP